MMKSKMKEKKVSVEQTQAEAGRLSTLRHPEPHSFLGVHDSGEGLVVRAYRPEAEAILVLSEGETLPMVKVHDTGLFELHIPNRTFPFAYRLEVQYPGKQVYGMHDSYSVAPTLGEVDVYLAGEGRHEDLWRKLGAHPCTVEGTPGVAFAVWAPTAEGVSVVGEFNSWDGRLHMLRKLGASGIWETFVPEVQVGALYKYEIRTNSGRSILKTDPFALSMEMPPNTASRVFLTEYNWMDEDWMNARESRSPWTSPVSIYEMHMGSWRRKSGGLNDFLSYREMAPILAEHLATTGFTHVQFMPVMEHPFAGSWGYQVSGYFAPTARFGGPDDFRFLVDYLHQRGIGVLVDWVPAHFPKDDFALGRFDGTALFEHLDPRQGEHPDWGTFVFNFGRREVRNFLMSSALHWLSEYHIDGLRVDAVASMLYLDYSRNDGEWVANQHGGRENLEAVEFLKEVNAVCHRRHPGIMMIAEESTSWPKVSRPTEVGGLGFGFKWNMGWMHDTLEYFTKDPIYRAYHHQQLTFGFHYAFSENFILPLSHDEVVHGKGSLIRKMPGDRWQQFANLRALYAWMWAHPGKKMLFMGCEFGQDREWNHDQSLDWHLLDNPDGEHSGLMRLVGDLNRIYRSESALWQCDFKSEGFQWVYPDGGRLNVVAFLRRMETGSRHVLVAANLSPLVRPAFRFGLPEAGVYREILNSDAGIYGGSNIGNLGQVTAEPIPWQGQPFSVEVTLPPLGVIWLAPSSLLL